MHEEKNQKEKQREERRKTRRKRERRKSQEENKKQKVDIIKLKSSEGERRNGKNKDTFTRTEGQLRIIKTELSVTKTLASVQGGQKEKQSQRECRRKNRRRRKKNKKDKREWNLQKKKVIGKKKETKKIAGIIKYRMWKTAVQIVKRT